ncbi:MAG TPA: glycerophosphodiester phosphodiesterase family protein [Anaerolineae bacterium]|nr:glycerophosphodiester phosphodiesterase family protein [Anaerolineae bacterium]
MPSWQTAKGPMVLGHRGVRGALPENSMMAFENAIGVGAVGIECDIRLSREGVPVIIHDGTVDRTTNGKGRVGDQSVDQLQGWRLEGREATIPTVEELFARFGSNILYNLEMKEQNLWAHHCLKEVAKLIKKYQVAEQVLFSSFYPLSVWLSWLTMPKGVKIGMLYERIQGRSHHVWLPIEAIHPYHQFVTEGYMRWARQRGYLVNVWTVNEPAEGRRLARLGVDGIITDKPEMMLAVVGE